MKVGVFATHPIQYQVPLWRGLNEEDEYDLCVFYFSEQGVSGAEDPGFGKHVIWDIPLLEGYSSRFLSNGLISKINSFRIDNPKRLLDELDLDVVVLHGYTHRFARQLIRLKSKYGYKVILRGEFTEMARRATGFRSVAKRIYLSWFYRYVDHFCPIGEDARDHLRLYGIDRSKTTFAPYSVDDALVDQSLEKYNCGSSRSILGIPDDHLVFLFSGKMIPRKQPLLLAEAFLSLSRNHKNFTAIFLGSGEQYQALCEKMEPTFGRHFIAPGFVNQSELGLYFTAADVFVLPSTYDTWGLVVNEAMHYSLPCIVSDKVGSRRDLVTPGETGEIFEFDSLSELQGALEQFMEDPGSASFMGKKALERIQGYTIDATLAGLKSSIGQVSNR
jgi:glycosyltransferase involved in cell wall biosynthesis